MYRAVVLLRATVLGARARVMLPLPLVACSGHAHDGALTEFARVRFPRPFARVLGRMGALWPNWGRARVRFVSLVPPVIHHR
jgi:hypothetical protein